MASTIIPVEDFDCVVFGATGDLTLRKLLPALYQRFRDRQFSDACRIIAAARSDLTDDAYRHRAEDALKRHVPADELPADTVAAFLKLVFYVRVNGAHEDGWEQMNAAFAGTPDRIRVLHGDIARTLRCGVQESATSGSGDRQVAGGSGEADRA